MMLMWWWCVKNLNCSSSSTYILPPSYTPCQTFLPHRRSPVVVIYMNLQCKAQPANLITLPQSRNNALLDKEFLIVLFCHFESFPCIFILYEPRGFLRHTSCVSRYRVIVFFYRMSPGKSNTARRSTSSIYMVKNKSH